MPRHLTFLNNISNPGDPHSVSVSGGTQECDLASYTNFAITPSTSNNNTLDFNISNKVIGQSGTIVITNPSSGTVNWNQLPDKIKTPESSTIDWIDSASGVAVVSYYVASSTSVLINYVGNFGSSYTPE